MSLNVTDAISNAFSNLSELNESLYDYWISELYDVDGDLIWEKWTEETLAQMENDVMMNS